MSNVPAVTVGGLLDARPDTIGLPVDLLAGASGLERRITNPYIQKTGLALAGLLSVIMSTADSYLLVSVQTCVHDIGKTINPNMTEKREILFSRIFSIILPLGALVIALYIQNAYDILMFSWSFYAAACGLPCFASLYWRKATSAGIIAGMIAGFVVCVGWKLAGLPFGLGAAVPGAIACAIALVCVSLATYQKHPSVYLDAA